MVCNRILMDENDTPLRVTWAGFLFHEYHR